MAFLYKECKRTKHSFIKNGKERKEQNVLFINNTKERKNELLLKRTDAQPCRYVMTPGNPIGVVTLWRLFAFKEIIC